MKDDARFTNNRQNAADFLIIFERLLSREKFELEKTDISFLFEVIASNLLPESKVYFDGATGLSAKTRKTRQVEFIGKMWVGGNKKQWLESFSATVTDKRITKQGVWFKIQVGDSEAEGNLSEAFYLPEESDNELLKKNEEARGKIKTQPTNQWSEGGNSDFLINIVFLPFDFVLAVSASLISTVGLLLVNPE